MRRVVLDTSVVVAASRSRSGAAFAILDLTAERRLTPLVTSALFLEYEEVLKRPDQRAASGLTMSQVEAILAALAAVSEPVEVRFKWRPQLGDPDDELVLEVAVNGRADALVTHNIADFRAAAQRFDLEVLTPGSLLERIRS